MRRLSTAICTSGDPVSLSARLYSSMIWDFCSLTSAICDRTEAITGSSPCPRKPSRAARHPAFHVLGVAVAGVPGPGVVPGAAVDVVVRASVASVQTEVVPALAEDLVVVAGTSLHVRVRPRTAVDLVGPLLAEDDVDAGRPVHLVVARTTVDPVV